MAGNDQQLESDEEVVPDVALDDGTGPKDAGLDVAVLDVSAPEDGEAEVADSDVPEVDVGVLEEGSTDVAVVEVLPTTEDVDAKPDAPWDVD